MKMTVRLRMLLVALTALLLTGGVSVARGEDTGVADLRLSIEPLAITPDAENVPLLIRLEGSASCFGLQTEVTLPSGLGFDCDPGTGKPCVELTGRTAGFAVVTNLLSADRLRLAIFSTDHSPIGEEAENPAVLILFVSRKPGFTGGDATLANILLTIEGDRDMEQADTSTMIESVPYRAEGSLEVAPASIEPGSRANPLSLLLDMEMPCYGFQTELTLPSGLSFDTDPSTGRARVELTERTEGFAVVTNLLSADRLRVAIFSTDHSPIGEESEESETTAMMTLFVSGASSFRGGEVSVANTLVTGSSDMDFSLPDSETKMEVYVPANSFFPEKVETGIGKITEISFLLDNETPFTSFQTDIIFPEEVIPDPDSVRACERLSSSHTLSARCYEGGLMRIVCFTPDGVEIEGTEGPLFTIEAVVESELPDDSEIRTLNTVFSTAKAREYRLPDASAPLLITEIDTGARVPENDPLVVRREEEMMTVSGLEAGETLTIYDLNGILIESIRSDGHTITLPVPDGPVILATSDGRMRKIRRLRLFGFLR